MSTDREIDMAREMDDARWISPEEEPEENQNDRAIGRIYTWIESEAKCIEAELKRAVEAGQWGAVIDAAELLDDIEEFRGDESLDPNDYNNHEFIRLIEDELEW